MGWGWGGVGWGNTNPTSCYASGSLSMFLHERLATLVDLCLCFYMNSMGWGWGGVGWGNTNPTSCYASGSLSMLLHELDGVGLGWGGVGWGGVGWGGVIPAQRLATLVGLCLCFYMNSMGWGWVGVGWGGVIPAQRLATLVGLCLRYYEVDATLLDLRWHFTMKLTLRYLIFVDTSLWIWRYATWFSLALGWDVESGQTLRLRYMCSVETV